MTMPAEPESDNPSSADEVPQIDLLQRSQALQRMNFYMFTRHVIHMLFPEETISSLRFLEAMCRAIHDVVDGEQSELLITIPPRHFKSTCVSVALPAFVLGHHPDWEIMVVTYSQEFATVHSNQFRQVLEGDWYRDLFPDLKIARGQNRVDEIRTTRGGGRKAASVTGSITGRGAHLLIMDDMMKAQDIGSEVERERVKNVYREALYSRQNNMARSRKIAVQQRLGEDDFAGFLLETGNYRHFNLPAIADRDETLPLYYDRSFMRRRGEPLNPDREPLEVLERTRRSMGQSAFACQYLQDPTVADSPFVRFDEIPKVPTPPDRDQCAPVVQSWDTAFTTEPSSAYSVCTTWGHHLQKWYLLDVHRVRLDMPDLQDRIVSMARTWSADRVIIESDGSGQAIVSQLRKDGYRQVQGVPTKGRSKEERLVDQSARLISGDIVIPTDVEWYEGLRQEFRSFPTGMYKDQVDSVTQFVAWINGRMGKALMNRDPKTGRRIRRQARRQSRTFRD